ncbi:hypothetical protein [Clostridium butyricum]|uniref:hypothetical protein n=1 Tax=Clostridium butyricum TaxID=1492 RepID=UPI00374EC597
MQTRYKFNFPKMFLFMNDLGWLNTNEHNNYLWIYDMEWISCEKIKCYNYEDEADNIVPFAYTSGGDKWAWCLMDDLSLPIVFCPQDDDEAIFYAKDLQSAIFRQILQFASENNFYLHESDKKSWQIDETTAKKYFIEWKRRLEKWFDYQWIKVLDSLIDSKLKYCQVNFQNHIDKYHAFLSQEEVKNLIDKYIKFDLLDESVIWTKLEE